MALPKLLTDHFACQLPEWSELRTSRRQLDFQRPQPRLLALWFTYTLRRESSRWWVQRRPSFHGVELPQLFVHPSSGLVSRLRSHKMSTGYSQSPDGSTQDAGPPRKKMRKGT